MNIGTLSIEIAADIARLRTDMNEVKRTVGTTMRDVEGSVAAVRGAFAALGVAVSAGAFVQMVRGAVDARAKLYDLHLVTGMSVESLSSMDEVARFAGTELSQVANSSQRLSRTLAENGESGKKAADALRAIGINAAELRQLSPEQQMLAVAKALDRYNDSADKGVILTRLMGREGAQMMPFMKELAERQAQMTPITEESARAAKEYQDNVVQLRMSFEEWQRQIVGDLIPSLNDLTTKLVDGRKAAGGWSEAILNALQDLQPGSAGEQLAEVNKNLADMEKHAEAIHGRGFLGRLWETVKGNRGLAASSEVSMGMEISVLRNRRAYLLAQQAREALALGEGITDRFTPRRLTLPRIGGEDTKEVKNHYDDIIASVRAKIAADELELSTGEKLTAGQREALDVMEKIRAGLSGTTREQNAAIAVALERRLAIEQLVEAQRAEAKWSEEAAAENARAVEQEQRKTEALQESARAARDQADTYGMAREEVEQLETARLRETAAALRQRAEWARSSGFLEQQAQLWRDQAAALEDMATSRERIAMINDRDQRRAEAQRTRPGLGAIDAMAEYGYAAESLGDQMHDFVGSAIRDTEDAIVHMALTGENVFRRMIDVWLAEIIRMYAIKPALSFLGDALVNAFQGSGGTNLFANTGNVPPSYSTGMEWGPPKAAGGPVGPWSIQRVNELGPELLSVGGRDYLMMGGKGGVVTPAGGKRIQVTMSPVINIDARTDQAQVAQLVGRALAENNRRFVEMLEAGGVT